MKRSERDLLSNLRHRQSGNIDDPLQKVKQSLGYVSNMVGNPLTRTEISLHISIRYYDPGLGVIVPPAGIVPAGMTRLPVYLFGLTDYWGGYNNMSFNIPIVDPWIRPNYSTLGLPPYGIYGVTSGVIGGLIPALENQLSAGDMLQQYVIFLTDVAMVIIHCDNIAYGTFLSNFSSDVIFVEKIRFIIPLANINQMDNPLLISHQSQFGATVTDYIDPKMFQLPTNMQNNIIDIPINMPMDKNIMAGFYMNFDCTDIDMIMFIQAVEPLKRR